MPGRSARHRAKSFYGRLGYSAMSRMDKAADALMDALVQAVSAGLFSA